MGTSKSQPNDWMTKDGTGKISTFADERGWCIQHADGQIEVIHAVSGAVESPANPADIVGVANPADGTYAVSDVLTFTVTWNEPVVVTGTPTLNFDEDGVRVGAEYVAGSSTPTSSVFTYTLTTTGDVDNVVETLDLTGGDTITDANSQAVEAELTLEFVDATLDDITIDSAGGGYSGSETITIDAPNLANSTATVTITETGGVIDGLTLTDGGYGYETGTIAVTTGNADATVDITVTDGVITAAVLNAAGTGYSAGTVDLAAPTLTVTTATADVDFTDAVITGFTITEAGYGYDGDEGYTLETPAGTPVNLGFNADYEQPTGIVVA